MSEVLPLSAFKDNYIWIILDDHSSDFCAVDPGDAAPVIHFAEQQKRKLTHILLTHHHQDHIGGVPKLRELFPECLIYGPNDPRIADCQPAIQLTLFNIFFEVLATPGHTSSHISYFAPEKGWLFCGDTLFSSGCGRVFDGSMLELYQSMQLFKQLPDETLVYCAHEYTKKNLEFAHLVDSENLAIQEKLHKLSIGQQCSLPSTLAFEKAVNPFLRTDKSAVQQFAIRQGARSDESLDIFTVLRKAKDRFN